MMKRTAACVAGLAAAALFPGNTAMAQAGIEDAFDSTSIVIQASEWACYEFAVWLAVTPEQQRRGLMHVRQLPKFSGMLFIYRTDARRSMWMKNTYIALDMLFIRADGTVASIASMTEPLSLDTVSSEEPVRYVLELNGGLSAELGFEAGSVVHLPELH